MSSVEDPLVTASSLSPPSRLPDAPTNPETAASATGKGADHASPELEAGTAAPRALLDGDETTDANEVNPQSQPMTATASTSSSVQPPLETGDNAASSYGTRSRNRTGGPRPNYAEDRELDLEIEALSKPSRSSKRSAGTTVEPQLTGFTTVNATHQPEKPAESANNVVTPAPTPAPAPSKKRKHPGSNNTVPSTSANATSSRSKPIASISFRGYVETNMMSFLQGGYKLNAKKQLVADDGTTVQANGKLVHSRYTVEEVR